MVIFHDILIAKGVLKYVADMEYNGQNMERIG
jgi:hypothetical protein